MDVAMKDWARDPRSMKKRVPKDGNKATDDDQTEDEAGMPPKRSEIGETLTSGINC